MCVPQPSTGRGRCSESSPGPARLEAGREAVLDDIAMRIAELRDRFGAAGLAGVGVAVPGFIDLIEGRIVGSNNLAVLDGTPVRDDLSARLATKVTLENDANAAALGEKWLGAGRDVDSLVLLTLGTGIGGGVIVDGRILHGAVGMAGEFGHMTVYPGGNPCGCGNDGCLEKHASATAIAAMARLLLLGDGLTAEDVFALAQGEGDAAGRARHVFESMGTALGIAIANLVNIFNAPLYLVSGGPLPAWELFAPTLFREAERRSFTFRNTRTRIERATLGSEAGLYGAAYLPFLEGKDL